MAKIMSVLYALPRKKRFPRFALAKAHAPRSVEALLLQAYLQLVRVPWNESGTRSTSLARFGHYEVRLLERMLSGDADVPHLSVELYARKVQTPIDACGCDDIEAAAFAAERIMCRARQLEEGERRARSAVLTAKCG
jgi:hypothetical protein